MRPYEFVLAMIGVSAVTCFLIYKSMILPLQYDVRYWKAHAKYHDQVFGHMDDPEFAWYKHEKDLRGLMTIDNFRLPSPR